MKSIRRKIIMATMAINFTEKTTNENNDTHSGRERVRERFRKGEREQNRNLFSQLDEIMPTSWCTGRCLMLVIPYAMPRTDHISLFMKYEPLANGFSKFSTTRSSILDHKVNNKLIPCIIARARQVHRDSICLHYKFLIWSQPPQDKKKTQLPTKKWLWADEKNI